MCVLLVVTGSIAASAASLDERRKTLPFSTDHRMTPSVLKPAETTAKHGPASRAKKVKVQKIKPITQSPGKVEVDGFVFNRPTDASPATIVQGSVAPVKK